MTSVLSDADKQRILDTEILKKEISEELGRQPAESRVSKFLKHPAVLLLLVFFFTTGLSSWLTYFWNRRQWDNEQSRLSNQHELDKKYSLIETVIRNVAETNTAAEDVLEYYPWKNPKQIREVTANWRKKSREWRVNSKVLRQDLAIFFLDTEVVKSFEELVQKRRQLNRDITNLIEGDKGSDAKRDKDEALKLINDANDLLQVCGTLMASETINKQYK